MFVILSTFSCLSSCFYVANQLEAYTCISKQQMMDDDVMMMGMSYRYEYRAERRITAKTGT